MTIKELTDDNRALTKRVDELEELLREAEAEIERLDALLNPKPEGSK